VPVLVGGVWVGGVAGEGVGFSGEVGGGHVLEGFEGFVHGESGDGECGLGWLRS
jgi:hypothetical protein